MPLPWLPTWFLKDHIRRYKFYLFIPFRYVVGRIALSGEGVKDETQFATLFSRSNSVQADKEFGAIGWIGVFRVGIGDTQTIGILSIGTHKSRVVAFTYYKRKLDLTQMFWKYRKPRLLCVHLFTVPLLGAFGIN